jgi:hypothetical protein
MVTVIYGNVASKLAAVLICACAPAWAADVLGPFLTSSNFAVDLQGKPDHRPYTYGLTAESFKYIQFHPPAGYAVRILRVDGDFVAMPETNVPAPKAGTGAWVLFAVNANQGKRSGRCEPCDDTSFITLQNAWPGNPRIQFDRDIHASGILGPDNKLQIKMATFFNTTGLFIHMEPTLNVTYQFEREKQP